MVRRPGPGSDLEPLLVFVKARIVDQVRRATGDPLRADWLESLLTEVKKMEAYLWAVPPSAYEVERFLLRIAHLYRRHPDYLSHWDLRQPG
ncbi:hypothetical protein P5P86_02570 [Nocardioides sp. BP30]|uniref:hypothetical protein n=1 Tax=Nocardioides sp. BP30 TaxID=3036374 RepID=UPI0024689A88|nr:hypothetical protein [Nocardioides sp. BP30]WGL52717.1 hypothetical protein P5P86_02570 [Nocardioides sp. BP30]